eukprot:scaffold26203_cov65-Phaeocystis_antarctica.AAC.1
MMHAVAAAKREASTSTLVKRAWRARCAPSTSAESRSSALQNEEYRPGSQHVARIVGKPDRVSTKQPKRRACASASSATRIGELGDTVARRFEPTDEGGERGEAGHHDEGEARHGDDVYGADREREARLPRGRSQRAAGRSLSAYAQSTPGLRPSARPAGAPAAERIPCVPQRTRAPSERRPRSPPSPPKPRTRAEATCRRQVLRPCSV